MSSEVKAAFGVPQDEPVDENRGLADMGMDSLMSVNLQNKIQVRVGLPLPTTLVLDYPNISALARFLDAALFGGARDSQGSQTIPPEEAELTGEIDAIAAMSTTKKSMLLSRMNSPGATKASTGCRKMANTTNLTE